MLSPAPLPPLAALVRRSDPDRFLASLFAPPAARETLFVLYAFNHELARARDVTSQPMLALIRLQWWREVVEGAERRHEIATQLRIALDRGALGAQALLGLIAAREAEIEAGLPDLAAWRAFISGTAGGLSVAAGQVLGHVDPAAEETLRAAGAAYGAARLIHGVTRQARAHRCLLPAELLTAAGLTPEDVIAAPGDARLGPVLDRLRHEAAGLLARARRRLPRELLPATLPAVLAARDLRRTAAPPHDGRPLGDRLAVILAGLRGRLERDDRRSESRDQTES